MKITSIEEIEYEGDVYNLHVEDNHNYFANDFIVANCHGAKAKVAQDILRNYCNHIPYRFGVTGTLPKPETEKKLIQAVLGEKLYEISASQLIEMGYLAKVDIQPICIQENVSEDFPDYKSEKSFLSKNKKRMSEIADIIIGSSITHGNTLVLVNSVSFGEKLAKMIKGSVFLYGNSKKDIRKEYYDLFEERDDMIVIATAGIASTGISINRIFSLIFVDAGKSFIKAIQSVGRGLRKGRDKDEVKVYDIYSSLKWATDHYKKRKNHYKENNYPILSLKKITIKE